MEGGLLVKSQGQGEGSRIGWFECSCEGEGGGGRSLLGGGVCIRCRGE